jgi:hypothetical protein
VNGTGEDPQAMPAIEASTMRQPRLNSEGAAGAEASRV